MKGRFSLFIDHESGNIYLDKLRPGKCSMEEEILAVGFNQNINGRTVAHDILEHSQYHRRTGILTLENELRAVGAADFVRSVLTVDEVIELYSYKPKQIKPIPLIMQKYIDNNDLLLFSLDEAIEAFSLEEDEYFKESLMNALYQVTWGFLQKQKQYNGDRNEASNDFRFISDQAEHIMNCIYDDFHDKITVSFDTHTCFWWVNSYHTGWMHK